MPNNLALNVSVGAFTHKSMGKAFKDATKQTKKMGKFVSKESKQMGKAYQSVAKSTRMMGSAFQDTNRKLRTANQVQKYRDDLEKLKRQQEITGDSSGKLAARIKRTQAQLTSAEHQAKDYGLALGSIAREQRKLNAISKGQKFVGKVGSTIRSGAGKVAGMSALAGGLTVGGSIAALTGTNRMTAENAMRSEMLGLDYSTAAALGGALKEAGVEQDAVLDMFEELNNKFGESLGVDELAAVTDSLKMLGLEFEHLAVMKPEQQFMRIMEAARQLEDQQKAVSALDILMSGESNKIISYFRYKGKAMADYLDEYKQYSVLTGEGIAGAQSFTVAINKLTASLGSAFQEVSGLVGAELSETITGWSGSLVKTFNENRESITKFIGSIGPLIEGIPGKLEESFKKIGRIITALDKFASLFVDDEDEVRAKKQRQYTNVMNGLNSLPDSPQTAKAKAAIAQSMAANAGTAASGGALPGAGGLPPIAVTTNVHNAQNLDTNAIGNIVEDSVARALKSAQDQVAWRQRGSMWDGAIGDY